jgi:hypothetical protein
VTSREILVESLEVEIAKFIVLHIGGLRPRALANQVARQMAEALIPVVEEFLEDTMLAVVEARQQQGK